jgi:hypothetical protein
MKKIFLKGLILLMTARAYAGSPFECTLKAENGAQIAIFSSSPVLGHGTDNWATKSISFENNEYLFEAQSNIFDDNLILSVHSQGFFSSAKNYLYFSHGGTGIYFDCHSTKKSLELSITNENEMNNSKSALSDSTCGPMPHVRWVPYCCNGKWISNGCN